jgi:two-component system phosphate regulon response regulator PhoB
MIGGGSDGSATERPHVLIVSDDPELGAFLAEGLRYGGFWTSTIASALQTLEVFRLRSFDLVLVDAALAGLGAIELVRRLRGRSDRAGTGAPRTDVPVLLVAGGPGEVEPAAAAAAGADGVVAAPIELAELAQRLHRVVGAWRAAHPDRPFADAAAHRRPGASEREDGY